jgi:hypothetical protein
METGNIQIIREEGKALSVEVQLTNGDLWMQSWQMARFFNVFNQKIEANLRSIFQSHLLWESDCTRTYRYVEKGVEKQAVYYNMEVLIFLSYRIASFEAGIFRQFVNEAFREHVKKKDKPLNCKIIWIAPPCYN